MQLELASCAPYLGGVVFRLEDIPSNPSNGVRPAFPALADWGTAPADAHNLRTKPKGSLANALPYKTIPTKDNNLKTNEHSKQCSADSSDARCACAEQAGKPRQQ